MGTASCLSLIFCGKVRSKLEAAVGENMWIMGETNFDVAQHVFLDGRECHAS